MTREEYEALKAGNTDPVSDEQDAAVQEDQEIQEEITEPEVDSEEQIEEPIEEPTEPTEIELPEDQKTAFQKALEREKRKLREKAEEELTAKFESQYAGHKKIVDMLGGDPATVEKLILERQRQAEAEKLAYENNWTDEQLQWYTENQKQQHELQELRTQVQINELKDDPKYAGIGQMKSDILAMVQRSGGAIDVKQAYWALGEENRASQIQREAEQRAIAKRSQSKRTVQSDSSTSEAGSINLSPEDEKVRKALGMSEQEAKALLQMDEPANLKEFRKRKKG